MRIIKTALLIFAGSGLILGACSDKQEQAGSRDTTVHNALSPEQRQLASIRTGRLEYRVISPVVNCTGEIEVPPQGMASVAAPLGGYIMETDIVPGASVRKGQLLATLSNPEYITLQQSYLETSGQLKFAEQEFGRQKMLQEQNATAVKRLQESESAFTVLKARLAGLKAQLQMIGINLGELEQGKIQTVVSLRSPMTGYVTLVNRHPGEFVEPRDAIFEIVNPAHLHLHLNVFEQDISDIHKGQEIRFRPAGTSSGSYTGRVLLVSPKRNEEARSFDIHGHIETGEDKLKPGMYVDAQIMLSADTVPSVPAHALVYSGNRAHLITEVNGEYHIDTVETGAKMEGWVEIKDPGVLRGKNIITEGASRLFAALSRKE